VGRYTLGSCSKHCHARARTSFSRGVRSSLAMMDVGGTGVGCVDVFVVAEVRIGVPMREWWRSEEGRERRGDTSLICWARAARWRL